MEKKLIVFLLLVFLVSGLEFKIGKDLIARELNRLQEQRITLRVLSQKEQIEIYLYNEATKQGISLRKIRTLLRVIKAESNFDINAHNKVSNDWGLFQIHESSWDKKAMELGYDYKNNWRDNIQMGLYIYKTQGLNAWNWSRSKWI